MRATDIRLAGFQAAPRVALESLRQAAGNHPAVDSWVRALEMTLDQFDEWYEWKRKDDITKEYTRQLSWEEIARIKAPWVKDAVYTELRHGECRRDILALLGHIEAQKAEEGL